MTRKCPKCGQKAKLSVKGSPPEACECSCAKCKAKWDVCGAKTKSGNPCMTSPMPNGRCRKHGGPNQGRPVLHGRRSKYLPQRLQERAEEALSDSDLVSVREDIALIEALVVEEIETMGGDVSQSERWAQALALIRILKEAHDSEILNIASADPDGGDDEQAEQAKDAFWKLQAILADGERYAQALQRTLTLIEQKRKLADTEIKRLHALGQFMTAQQANVLVAAVLSIVREEVKDRGTLANVGRRLVAIVGPSHR